MHDSWELLKGHVWDYLLCQYGLTVDESFKLTLMQKDIIIKA